MKNKNNTIVRLQSFAWHRTKNILVPLYEKFYENEKGHICGYYINSHTKKLYYHWLNDQEIKEYHNRRENYD